MQNIDQDGYINIDYYTTAARDIVDRVIRDKGLDPEKINTNQVNNILRQVYISLFRPERVMLSDPNYKACNVEYNDENIRRLLAVYVAVAGEYDALPSVEAFTAFCGISEQMIDKYVTGGLNVFRKVRKAYIQNRLNNTPIGVMTLANNDRDTGLLYTQQNFIASEVAKKSLSFADLQRIAEKAAD